MGKFEKSNRAPAPASRQTNHSPKAAPKAPKKAKSKLPLVLGILGSIFVILSCILGYLILRPEPDDGTVAKNVYVAGIDLGGLGEVDAAAALQEVALGENMEIRLYTKGDEFQLYTTTYDPKNEVIQDIFGKPLENAQQTVAIPEKDPPETDDDAPVDENGVPYLRYSTIMIPADEIQLTLDVDAAVTEAMRYGREIGEKDNPERIDIDITQFLTLNEEYIRELLAKTLEETALDGTDTTWKKGQTTITDEEGNPQQTDAIEITFGTMSRSLNTEKLFEEIVNGYMTGNYKLQYVLDEIYPQPCDLDALYEEFDCIDPVNAFCDEDTYEITDGKNGYGFRMSDALLALVDVLPGDSVSLPLTELVPMHTRETLEAQLFCDVLATVDSRHVWNNNRTRNLELSAQAIDGYILKPGEIFSFNEVVGQRTAAKGYKEAGVYVGGRTEQQLGGGICQVASTLFYCTLYSNLEVVERTEHQYLPDYIPYGMDATIYWGSLDYKFRNNTAYPIRIDCTVEDGKVKTRFIGTETKDYTVKMEYEITLWKNYEEVTVDITPDMEDYEKYKDFKTGDVIQIGYAQANVTTYMYKYDLDGNLISKEAVFYSRYSRRNREIANVVGEEASTDPTESVTPPTESTTPPTESTTPPTESTAPPTESTAPPTESTQPAAPPEEENTP